MTYTKIAKRHVFPMLTIISFIFIMGCTTPYERLKSQWEDTKDIQPVIMALNDERVYAAIKVFINDTHDDRAIVPLIAAFWRHYNRENIIYARDIVYALEGNLISESKLKSIVPVLLTSAKNEYFFVYMRDWYGGSTFIDWCSHPLREAGIDCLENMVDKYQQTAIKALIDAGGIEILIETLSYSPKATCIYFPKANRLLQKIKSSLENINGGRVVGSSFISDPFYWRDWWVKNKENFQTK